MALTQLLTIVRVHCKLFFKYFFRGYAANCRVKREEEEKSLEKENADLSENIKRNKRKAHEEWRGLCFYKYFCLQ